MFKISNNSYFITYPYHENNTKIYDSYNKVQQNNLNTHLNQKQTVAFLIFVFKDQKFGTHLIKVLIQFLSRLKTIFLKENVKIELLTSYWINHCFPFLNVCTLMYAWIVSLLSFIFYFHVGRYFSQLIVTGPCCILLCFVCFTLHVLFLLLSNHIYGRFDWCLSLPRLKYWPPNLLNSLVILGSRYPSLL